MVLHLVLARRLHRPILFLSGYINKHRSDYYRLLRGVTQDDNWKDWIIFILTAIEVQSKATAETILAIMDLMQEYRKQIKEKSPKIYSIELIEYLFSIPFYNQKSMVNSFDVTRKTAAGYFKLLESYHFISSKKAGRDIIYYNNKLVELLK